ncbi:MAG: zinc ribbon domain-containing protein [Planctomycetota bacterium]|nr:zinc ribbon domain-containing protein [Planctomycetota bacterium]
MPHYDYRCSSCQHLFEVYQNMSDDLMKVCPECDKPHLKRLISGGGGILFRGNGFYQTDYVMKPPPEGESSSNS